jgi:DNA polymerase III alpha subunit
MPPTAKGMMFVMLEDETARMQVAVAPPTFERFRALLSGCSSLLVAGKVEGTPDGTQGVGHHRSLMVDQVRSLEEALGEKLFKADFK